MNPAMAKALIVAALAALFFVAGWVTEGWRKDAEIAAIDPWWE